MVDKKLLSQANTLVPRKVETVLRNSLFQKGIIILLGSRQVGKTSLMFRLILYLLEEQKILSSQVVYFDLEFPNILKQINHLYGDEFLNLLRAYGVDTEKPSYVFIDEIHYLDNPSSFLKVLHDHYPNLKLVVSGSSSLQIRHKFKETLTGRKRIFEINPIDFEEFLGFKNSPLHKRKKDINLTSIIRQQSLPDISELKFLFQDFCTLLEEFVLFGGYPQVVLTTAVEDKIALLAEIHRSYIRRDIKDFAHIENIEAFNNLIELLALQIGNLVNLSELTNSLNISRPTIEKYLFLLQNTFVLSLISPYYTNKRQQIIKSSKVFFHDTGLRNSLIRNLDPLPERVDRGMMIENAVFNELHKHLDVLDDLYFWRTKTKSEVDFIIKTKEILPIEVKYSPLKHPAIPSGLRSFINTYHPSSAIVVTKDFFGKDMVEQTSIFFIPAWAI